MLLLLLHSALLLTSATDASPSLDAHRSVNGSGQSAPMAAAHVPVPVPAENRTKNKSRRLKKKLPPI